LGLLRMRPNRVLVPPRLQIKVDYIAAISRFKTTGLLAFARHPRAALAAVVALPRLAGVVLAYPTVAKANRTIGIDHCCSRRTPLNFFAAEVFFAGFLTAINSPLFLFRLVQAVALPSLVFTCDRFFTEPLRALSPDGLFVAKSLSLRVGNFKLPLRSLVPTSEDRA
jgi:hypothetical protein